MFIKNLRDVEVEKIPAGSGVSRQILISADEAPNFAMRRFIIEPGGSMPMHTNTVEHEQLVLGGRAEVSLNGKVFEVGRDDVVLIPAGIPHSYRTLGSEPFQFLCLVPNQEDIIKVVGQD